MKTDILANALKCILNAERKGQREIGGGPEALLREPTKPTEGDISGRRGSP